MPVGIPTDPAIKAEILDKVKNHGLPVSQASKQYGIRANVIYAWMSHESGNSSASLMVELSRTKYIPDVPPLLKTVCNLQKWPKLFCDSFYTGVKEMQILLRITPVSGRGFRRRFLVCGRHVGPTCGAGGPGRYPCPSRAGGAPWVRYGRQGGWSYPTAPHSAQRGRGFLRC